MIMITPRLITGSVSSVHFGVTVYNRRRSKLLTVLSLFQGHPKQKPNPFRIMIGEEKVREYLQLLKRDHTGRRAASLLSGADLEEASRLFSRIPDELD